MTDWQPIETAPKDGTVIDIWLVDETGNGWRVTGAYYVALRDDEVHEFDVTRGIFVRTGYTKRDGWWAPNHDYDGGDGWCDVPKYFNPHPMWQKWVFKEATHWMPPPAPPVTEE